MMETLRAQIDSLSAQLQIVQQSLNDYSRAKETAKQYLTFPSETEMLVPIGGGVYLPAKTVNSGKGVVYTATGYSFEEPIERIVESMEKRIKEFVDASQKIYERMNQLQAQLNNLQAAVEEEARQQGKN
jgi:prefoldin alpha subunit